MHTKRYLENFIEELVNDHVPIVGNCTCLCMGINRQVDIFKFSFVSAHGSVHSVCNMHTACKSISFRWNVVGTGYCASIIRNNWWLFKHKHNWE